MMTRAEVVEFVAATEGRIFAVEFTKRSDGTLRHMVCRTGVRKFLVKGGRGPAYDPAAHYLLWVFDMQKQAYRSIAIEGLLRVKVEGQWHEVVDPPRAVVHMNNCAVTSPQ